MRERSQLTLVIFLAISIFAQFSFADESTANATCPEKEKCSNFVANSVADAEDVISLQPGLHQVILRAYIDKYKKLLEELSGARIRGNANEIRNWNNIYSTVPEWNLHFPVVDQYKYIKGEYTENTKKICIQSQPCIDSPCAPPV